MVLFIKNFNTCVTVSIMIFVYFCRSNSSRIYNFIANGKVTFLVQIWNGNSTFFAAFYQCINWKGSKHAP